MLKVSISFPEEFEKPLFGVSFTAKRCAEDEVEKLYPPVITRGGFRLITKRTKWRLRVVNQIPYGKMEDAIAFGQKLGLLIFERIFRNFARPGFKNYDLFFL